MEESPVLAYALEFQVLGGWKNGTAERVVAQVCSSHSDQGREKQMGGSQGEIQPPRTCAQNLLPLAKPLLSSCCCCDENIMTKATYSRKKMRAGSHLIQKCSNH